MKKYFPLLALAGAAFLPKLAHAYTCIAQPGTIDALLCKIGSLMNIIIPLLVTLGIIYFIWGVIKYVTAKDSDAQAEGRTVMISGIIALFVILSLWGLVRILQNTFGVTGGNPASQNLPNIQ